jgi:hypothetical protein
MTDEEYKKKDEEYKKKYGAATSANAGAAVGQSVRTAANFGGDFAKTLARPIPDAIMGVGKAIDNGVVAANNFVSSAIAGRPVQSMQPIAGSQAVAAPPRPAVAAPQIKSPIQAPPQRQSPSQRMTDSQANAAEVNARTATQAPTSPQTGVGASVGAGGAAPGGIVKSKDKNGNTVYTGTGAYAATGPAIAGTIGSVQNQNFGNAAVPQAQASIAQPRVASTFGMSVNDPRLNDQTPQSAAIAQPPQNTPRPQASAFGAGFASRMGGNAAPIERTGANFQMAVPNGVSYRGADAMAEAYNSREDREARQKLLSDLDSQRFSLNMIANNPGRRGRAAIEALGQLAQQQAALAAGGERLSAEAVQNRAQRNNVLANTGMEQAGQTTRQQMAGDVASQGQFLDYDAKNRATNASLIDKPQYVTDLSGNLVQIAGGKGTGVTGADGSVIKMPQTTKVDNDALSAVSKELTALINNPPEMGADATAHNNRLAELRAQQSAMLQPQAKPPAGYPNAKQAPDGKWYVKKDGATYLVN